MISDKLQRFLIENTNVRGELVQLDQAWQTLQATAPYPAPIRKILGEALAAVSLLATTIKFSGSLILQINATAPMHLLVVQATSDNTVRGLARWNKEIPDNADFQDLLTDGRIIITIEPNDGGERYQSIVSLNGGSLADSLASYFETSEQLQTRLWLAADDQTATGLLLQRLPDSDTNKHSIESEDESWNRTLALTETISSEELLTLDRKTILHRLYHEEELRLFDAESIEFKCQCSQQKVEQMVTSLGEHEARDIISQQGKIEVDCEFCNSHYVVDNIDVERLFNNASTPSTDSIH
ncbi:MAG TPA: Hsp33 family molecular chaperone HslO [Leucothrix mucor]|uniref:Hsp33 family molecular chaperone HslO n=1 Tax=Leucothrix mucor TaxID=45248 RepID=A0A7V2SYT6_LEUMU|nr:Hsp33 family molecular chaperone HslO [Leucothrix mucor]